MQLWREEEEPRQPLVFWNSTSPDLTLLYGNASVAITLLPISDTFHVEEIGYLRQLLWLCTNS